MKPGGTEPRLVLAPGAASRNRVISSGLNTTGIFLGSATKVSSLVTSGRLSVTEKKKRSAGRFEWRSEVQAGSALGHFQLLVEMAARLMTSRVALMTRSG